MPVPVPVPVPFHPIPTPFRFLPDKTDVGTLAPALENAVTDASGGQGASKLNFTRLNENIASLSEVREIRNLPLRGQSMIVVF